MILYRASRFTALRFHLGKAKSSASPAAAPPYKLVDETATTPEHLVGANEYLHTSYRPDWDYVDGFVLEHNWGAHPHGRSL